MFLMNLIFKCLVYEYFCWNILSSISYICQHILYTINWSALLLKESFSKSISSSKIVHTLLIIYTNWSTIIITIFSIPARLFEKNRVHANRWIDKWWTRNWKNGIRGKGEGNEAKRRLQGCVSCSAHRTSAIQRKKERKKGKGKEKGEAEKEDKKAEKRSWRKEKFYASHVLFRHVLTRKGTFPTKCSARKKLLYKVAFDAWRKTWMIWLDTRDTWDL